MPQAGVTCPQSLAGTLLPSGFFWPRALGVVSREGDAGGPSLFLDFVTASPPVCSHREGSAPAAASTSAHGLSTPQRLLPDAPRNTGRPCHPRPRPQGPGERGCRVSLPSPPAQDSLLRLEDHRQCFECSDVALNEAVQQMVNATETAAKEQWVATVTQLLQGMEQALSADGSTLRDLSAAGGLTRLTNNLIQVTWPLPSPPAPSQRLQPGELPAVTPRPAGHRLQHGCAGGAQGAARDLRAALGHPVPGHPAGGGRFPLPVPPAAAPEPGGRRCGDAGACLLSVCIKLRARLGSGARTFLDGGRGSVFADRVVGQGHGARPASRRVQGASPVRSGAPGPRATGRSWLGAWAAQGTWARAPLRGCDRRPVRQPRPLWGQWHVSESPEGSRSSRVAAAAWAGPAPAAVLRVGLRGEQGLHRLALEPGQHLRTCAQRARLEQTSGSVAFGQECRYLHQVRSILRFSCVFSINLMKVHVTFI